MFSDQRLKIRIYNQWIESWPNTPWFQDSDKNRFPNEMSDFDVEKKKYDC